MTATNVASSPRWWRTLRRWRGLLAMAETNPGMTRGGYYAVPRAPGGEPDREALLEAARARVVIRINLTRTNYGEA